MQHAGTRSGEGRHGRLVDRTSAERAAEHEYAGVLSGEAEVRPGGRAIGFERRDRPAGDRVARAVAPVDREGEAHPPRARRQQAVREAEVGVGLRQHQRDPPRRRGQPDRARDVPPAPENHLGAAVREDAPRGPERTRRPGHGTRRLERIVPADALDADGVDGISGGRHELGLGPLASDEADCRALSPQRVGDRDRRDDVPGRPAGGDHDPRRLPGARRHRAGFRRVPCAGGRIRRSRR